jgi:hypothetical protein
VASSGTDLKHACSESLIKARIDIGRAVVKKEVCLPSVVTKGISGAVSPLLRQSCLNPTTPATCVDLLGQQLARVIPRNTKIKALILVLIIEFLTSIGIGKELSILILPIYMDAVYCGNYVSSSKMP